MQQQLQLQLQLQGRRAGKVTEGSIEADASAAAGIVCRVCNMAAGAGRGVLDSTRLVREREGWRGEGFFGMEGEARATIRAIRNQEGL